MRERIESGLSVKEYCANAGFHENKYYYWQKKLREGTCTLLSDGQPNDAQHGMAPQVFAEVAVMEPNRHLEQPGTAAQCEIRLESANIKIIAGRHYPVGNIAELAKRLAQSC